MSTEQIFLFIIFAEVYILQMTLLMYKNISVGLSRIPRLPIFFLKKEILNNESSPISKRKKKGKSQDQNHQPNQDFMVTGHRILENKVQSYLVGEMDGTEI